MAENEKISYTMKAFYPQMPDAPLNEMKGYVEGFCKSIRVREVQTQKGKKKVADADITAIMPDGFVEKKFGKNFLNSYHSVRWKITYWGFDAENLEKYPPQKNQKMLCLVDRISIRENKSKDGRTYYQVEAAGTGTPDRTSRWKEGGESALAGSPLKDRPPEPDSFREAGLEFSEEDLPF